MTQDSDAIGLARALIQQRTVNPPSEEDACARHIGTLLQAEGFDVTYHAFAPGRTSVVAQLGEGDGLPLCFTGHLDTVPLGAAEWRHDPFAGTISDGKLYGRGSSDMKSGIAAFVSAALMQKEVVCAGGRLVLVLTASEETGCQGAAHLVEIGDVLGSAGAVVVAEPTANRPVVGHKGALWLRAVSTGVSAHGSMPEKGINAIYRAASAVARLSDFGFNIAPHPVLGSPSLSVGTFSSGTSINVVPDRAEIGIDIRTVPGMQHAALREDIEGVLGADIADLQEVLSLGHVWTDPGHPWIETVLAIVKDATGEALPRPQGASFFTDASILQKQYRGAPIIILGPGQPEMAHQTDEYCHLERIDQAVAIYARIISDWCSRQGPTTS